MLCLAVTLCFCRGSGVALATLGEASQHCLWLIVCLQKEHLKVQVDHTQLQRLGKEFGLVRMANQAKGQARVFAFLASELHHQPNSCVKGAEFTQMGHCCRRLPHRAKSLNSDRQMAVQLPSHDRKLKSLRDKVCVLLATPRIKAKCIGKFTFSQIYVAIIITMTAYLRKFSTAVAFNITWHCI